jgi:hypothetical protein
LTEIDRFLEEILEKKKHQAKRTTPILTYPYGISRFLRFSLIQETAYRNKEFITIKSK